MNTIHSLLNKIIEDNNIVFNKEAVNNVFLLLRNILNKYKKEQSE